MTKRKSASAKTKDQKANETYKPTDKERIAFQAYLDRSKAQTPTPRMKVDHGKGAHSVDVDHTDARIGNVLLQHALGTTNPTFANGLVNQLINLTADGREVDERALNSTLAMVEGIAPRDEVEAMLATQMAAVHNATMMAARMHANADLLNQLDSMSNMLNKLARTFSTQIETLKKYRSTGEQNIRVQHVTVNEGGQAIVGDVGSGRGSHNKKEHQPHEPCREIAPGTTVPCDVEAEQKALPGPSGERMVSMPLSRSKERSTVGET